MPALREFRVEHLGGAPPELPSFESVLAEVAREYPLDGREVVEWMQHAEAVNRLVEPAAEGYGGAGGLLDWASGDGNIPGVAYTLDGVRYRFRRMWGSEVRRLGGSYVEPGGLFVPLGGWRWVRFPRLLAALPEAWFVQYLGVFLAFLRLARLPVDRRVAFPRAAAVTLPLVFRDKYSLPAPLATYVVVVAVDRDAELTLLWHHGGTVVERRARLRRGENRVVAVLAFPSPSGYLELRVSGGAAAELRRLDRVPPV